MAVWPLAMSYCGNAELCDCFLYDLVPVVWGGGGLLVYVLLWPFYTSKNCALAFTSKGTCNSQIKCSDTDIRLSIGLLLRESSGKWMWIAVDCCMHEVCGTAHMTITCADVITKTLR